MDDSGALEALLALIAAPLVTIDHAVLYLVGVSATHVHLRRALAAPV